MNGSRKLLLVGWDAADWQIIDPLIQQGRMPHLAKLIEGGVRGNLASLQPMLSPMLWTSIATGKRPYKHGIHGFIEPMPDRSAVRPVTSTSRTSRAIWNMLTSRGMHSNAVGWFASHPAEPIKGVSVSNLFHRGCPTDEKWVVPDHSVHPPELAEHLGKLRVHDADLSDYDLLPFAPALQGRKLDDDKLVRAVAALAKLTAEMATIQSISTALLEQEPWDASFIYFDSIDHFCHGFMAQRGPKLDRVSQIQYDLFHPVVDGVYQFQDMMLGRALEFCNEDTTVIVCSDHGFLNDHLRPTAIPEGPQGPAAWHRFHGMIAMKGPGIRKGEQIYGSSVLDLCPTMLSILGLPIGEDMDGKVLASAFETPPQTQTIPSWENVEGEFGEHTEDIRVDPVAAAEAIQQMIDLGYVDELSEDVEDQVALAVRELKSNLAGSYADGYHYAEALELYKELAKTYPEDSNFHAAVAQYALELGDHALAQSQMDEAFQVYERTEDSKRKASMLPSLHLQQAQVYQVERRYAEAMEHYRKVEELAPRNLTLLMRMGFTHMKLRDYHAAERAFRATLEVDPNEPSAHYGLATIAFKRRAYEVAADHALTAVGLRHHMLAGHLIVAKSLARLGHLSEAIGAANTALSLRSYYRPAHVFLVRLYQMAGNEPLAELHRMRVREIDKSIKKRKQNRLDNA